MIEPKAYRYMLESTHGAEMVLSGKKYISFAGCNYLGLSGHPDLLKAGMEAYEKNGISTGGIGRHYDLSSWAMEEAEAAAAEFFGTEDAFYFASGYFISMIGLKALEDRFDVVFVDETGHYSIKDAVAMLGKPSVVFRHCHAGDLEAQLKTHLPAGKIPLIAGDGVFPTFGEIPPVDRYLELAEQYNGLIFLDEAHSVGCTGPNGRGSFDHYGLSSERIYFGGTLSKAFGGHGAVIPGTREFVRLLQQKSFVARGANMPAIPCAAHSAAALRYVIDHPEIREKLASNTRQLKDGVRALGFPMNDTEVPIVTIDLNDEKKTEAVHTTLLEKGIFHLLSHYIGASPGGVLRFNLSAAHSPGQVDYLLETLGKLV